MKSEKILVTSALPYANGPIHFGHIAGAYLPADIFVRYKRLTGQDVSYICGTDEHGFAITVSAQAEGNSPQEHVDKYHKMITGIFDQFQIQFDHFSRTSKKEHHKLSQEFFMELYKGGFISEKVTDQLYAESLNLFLADRYVEGTCPHCGYEEARGDECGNCGTWLEALELINPKCKINGETPVVRQTKHWFLNLDAFENKLQEWMKDKKNWKPNVTHFIQNMIEQGLHPRPITRDMEWGVPVPLPEAEGKVLYVWFDAPIGYMSATKEWATLQGTPEKWKDYWQNPDCRLVHFIGKDNLPFHCVVWPAMLMGQNTEYVLPTDVPANEFYNLEGKQFSKSTGWYVDLENFFQKYSADSIRYSIASNAPETKDSAFSWKDFQNRNNGELADVLGNFINRTLKFTASYRDNQVPERKDLTPRDEEVLTAIQTTLSSLENLYDTYQVRKACFECMELARLGNRYFDEKAPWSSRKDNPQDCSNTLNISIHLVRALSLALSPILPTSCEKIRKMLNLSTDISSVHWSTEKASSFEVGHTLGEAEVLFTKIEDAQIQEEVNALQSKLGTNGDEKLNTSSKNAKVKEISKKKETSSTNNLIAFEEVGKVQLQVAKVLEAEAVPKSKKLLKLQIDLGEEQRQVVAGIRESYTEPEKLVGQSVIAVTNLKPAKLMGIESQGMLLAAKHPEGLTLITVSGEVPVGSSVG
jgi:methionyl-tRNA synthetase